MGLFLKITALNPSAYFTKLQVAVWSNRFICYLLPKKENWFGYLYKYTFNLLPID
jgi:hypothetical protein